MKTNEHTTQGFLIGALLFSFQIFGQPRQSIFLDLSNLEFLKYRFGKSRPEPGGIGINIYPMTAPGFDPNTDGSLPVIAPNGTYTIRVGDEKINAEIDRLIYRFTVTPDKSILCFMYAIVLEDPDHEPHQQPKFIVRVIDENGQVIDRQCGYYEIVASKANGFKKGNKIVQYKPWSLVSLDLKPYIGRKIALDFTVYDCTETGHYGYAYLDAWFTQQDIEVKYCKDGDFAQLVAPPGFEEYKWSNGANGQVLRLKNVPVGQPTFTCEMASKMGCKLTLQANVNLGLSNPIIGQNISHVSCQGLLDGSIQLNVTGGTPPYKYTWSTGSNKSAISNLAPGIYTVSISDKIGCETVETIAVESCGVKIEAPPIGGSVRCAGGSDGGSSVRVSGGKPPYSIYLNGNIYLADTSLAFVQFQGLEAGSYDVEVKDSGGCSATTTFTVTGPPVLNLSATNIIDASCHGSSDGSICTKLSGGTPSYSVAWNDGASTANRNNLPAGSYSATITDANGCNAALLVDINQPLPVDFTVSVKDADCFGSSTGMAIIAILTPGDFSVVWSTGATGIVLANVPAGVYLVKVYNDTHCMVEDVRIGEPEQIHINPQPPMNHGFDISCFGGKLPKYRVRVGGGVHPNNIAFYNQPTKKSAASRQGKKATATQFKTDSVLVFADLSAGQYWLDITDANGCQQTAWFTVTEPMKLAVAIEGPVRVGCFGYHDRYAHSLPSGGVEPYSFQWVAEDSIISYEQNLDSIPQGQYILKVTDANGCTVVGKIRILGRPKLTIIIDPRTGKWRVPDKAGPVKVVSYNDALRGFELTISDDNGFTCSDTFSRPIKLPKGSSPPVWYKLHLFLRKIFPRLNRRNVKCYYFTSVLTLHTPIIITA